ncbi:hypothetical protein FACS189499_01730 [Clostridia bacterium]|nr:hypothetical protein FACS189499_01730 [Clostridia bacterium]
MVFAVTLLLTIAAFAVLASAEAGNAAGEAVAGAVANGAANPGRPTFDGLNPGNDTVSNDSETAVLQENPDAEIAPSETSALYDLIGIDASEPIEIIVLITLISVAPSILLMMTCYMRIIIVFGFLRNAMQTPTTPPNQVLTGLALFLTIFIMWPVFMQINEVAYVPYSNHEIALEDALKNAGDPLKDFMLKQTTNKNMTFFLELQERALYTPESAGTDNPVPADLSVTASEEGGYTMLNYREQLGFEVVVPAFMLSELSRAFQMGFMLFIPFLVMDLIISSTLMSMGMMMLPPAMISLPFKIMLFVLVDGWQMLIGSLISSYN